MRFNVQAWMNYNFSGMGALTYEEAIQKIEELEPRGWRLGLDRMEAFCRFAKLDTYLGSGPSPAFIHIAGTNGKGSTTAFVESLLRAGGYKTGAFFSPFVIDYRERIQSGGNQISKTDLARFTEELLEKVAAFGESEYGGITKFEFEAALGFLYWGQVTCDWVALEVGLGGRLDATNVVTPKCSIIVSIGLDHTAILGDTIEQISNEKAGIIKPGVPVVIGAMAPAALEVIENRAAELTAPVWRFGNEIRLSGEGGDLRIETPKRVHERLQAGLVGEKQPHNLALAVAALDFCEVPIGELAVKQGAQSAVAPGRFERLERGGVLHVVDGAHNADAAVALLETLKFHYANRKPWVLVANTVTGHDAAAFYRALKGAFEVAHIAPIQSTRALSPDEGAKEAAPFFESVIKHGSLQEALASARKESGPEGLVVVTGSNYLAGDALSMLLSESDL